MAVLIEVRKTKDASTVQYMSLYGYALDHFWSPHVKSFVSPTIATATPHGGYATMSFGQIIFSAKAFLTDWPPPSQLSIVMKYTATTEGAAVTLFTGDVFRMGFDRKQVVYSMLAPKFTRRLLDEGPDYDGNTVAYPKAFGPVTHVEPVRLADVGDQPTYHLGGLGTASDARTIVSFSSASAGAKTTIVVDSAHGWSNGESVTINGTYNFDGDHVIESVSGSTFVIPVIFPDDDTEKLPIRANAFTSGGFAVYDDGVPIQENVVINGDGTFSLDKRPWGTITISGTGEDSSLLGVVTWAQGRIPDLASIDSTYARSPSPGLAHWETQQQPLIDFVSEICASFTHYCYVKSTTLYLCDMFEDNGSDSLNEREYFVSSYDTPAAVSQVSARWSTYVAVEERVDETEGKVYVKEIPNVVVESQYTKSSGTTDSTVASALPDSGADFVTDGVLVGDTVYNITDDTTSIVEAVAAQQLTLQDDIFVSGEEYTVGPAVPQGQAKTINPFHTTKSNVRAALQDILKILAMDVAEVTVPIGTFLDDPGRKMTFLDTHVPVNTSTYIRVRRLAYDYAKGKVLLRGEGVIT